MRKHILVLLAALSVGASSAAPLFGSTVGYQYYAPNFSTPYDTPANGNHVVGDGVEIEWIVNRTGSLDINATQIILSMRASTFRNGGFSLWDVLGEIDAITGVTVDSTLADFGADRLRFTADRIDVNMGGLSSPVPYQVVLNLRFAEPSEVPEPATLGLLAVALGGLAFARRRR